APDQQEARQVLPRRARTRLASLVERSPRIRAAIGAAVSSYNGTPGQPDTFDRLDHLLDRQPYRVAHWKTAFDEINYRRFFDINDLGAIRVENCRGFDAAPPKILQPLPQGKITRLRNRHAPRLLASPSPLPHLPP